MVYLQKVPTITFKMIVDIQCKWLKISTKKKGKNISTGKKKKMITQSDESCTHMFQLNSCSMIKITLNSNALVGSRVVITIRNIISRQFYKSRRRHWQIYMKL
jgi:hypothetical protein